VEVVIRAFECNIRVRCGCEKTLNQLNRYLLPTLPRGGGDTALLICVDRDGEQYRITSGRHRGVAANFPALVVAVVRLVDDAVITRLSSLAAVHAGVVQVGNKAVLLPGGTHAGKSTLVAELVRRGANYFSDEYALIDAGGSVHPYARPLLLRRATTGQQSAEQQSPALVEELGGESGREPVSVGWVLSVQFQPTSSWGLNPVPQSEGLLILLRNTPHILAEQPHILETLGRASASAKCFVGRRGDALDAAPRILELCAS
jgi:hypothetical protein